MGQLGALPLLLPPPPTQDKPWYWARLQPPPSPNGKVVMSIIFIYSDVLLNYPDIRYMIPGSRC